MIRFSILLLICFSSLVGFSQQRTVFAGRILNPKGLAVKLEALDGIGQPHEAKLDKTGRFKMVLFLSSPNRASLQHGKEQTQSYLVPGDSVFIQLDTKQFDETIRYKGSSAVENNFLAKWTLDMENGLESIAFIQDYYRQMASRNPDDFAAYADSVAQLKLRYLEKHKEGLSDTFFFMQYANIVFDCLNDKADYPSLHFYLQGIQDSVMKVEDSYFKFYETQDINNDAYLLSENFVSYLDNYVTHYTRKELGRDSVSAMDKLKVAGEKLKGAFYEQEVTEIIVGAIVFGSPSEVEALYEFGKQQVKDLERLQQINLKYAEAAALFPGKQAPPFTLRDKDGKDIKLSDFRGKIVYIDFWASWCGPCMMELPYAKKLQDSFARKEIVFLYVSLDESKSDWLQTIKSKKMKGVHVRTAGFETKVAKAYAIQGIPTYYIIGRDGKIIAKNAPRPSDDAIYQVLHEALAK